MLSVRVTVCCDDVVVFFCKRQVPARVASHTLPFAREALLTFMTFVCKDAVPQGPSKRDRPEEGHPRLQVDEATRWLEGACSDRTRLYLLETGCPRP